MMLIRTTRQFILTPVLVLLVMVGCANDSDITESDSDRIQSFDEPNAQSPELSVRLNGRVLDDLICPGDRRPCLNFDGNISPVGDGFAWVAGRIVDGRLLIEEQLEFSSDTVDRDYTTNRCPDQAIVEAPPPEWMEANEGSPPVPGFADWWSSADDTFHIAVAGDGSEARAALIQQGVVDQVCLVSGFPASLNELQQLRNRLGLLIAEWDDHNTGGSFSAGIDTWTGTIDLYTDRLDPERRAAIETLAFADNIGNAITINIQASIEVINGTLDDYDNAMTVHGENPSPVEHMVAACDSVRFNSIPPDVNEFPPLDDDALAALNELVEGPTGVEAEDFDVNFAWSIAFRDDDRLVLFGQGSQPGDYVDVAFERRADAWTPTGWGGCSIKIEAPGFGVAEVFLDPKKPISPDATELALLISELNCASGQAPDGRDIVPLVAESDISVEITVFVEPVIGSATCQGNPLHPITVSLQNPIGDRELLDAHRQPPTPIVETNQNL